RLLQRSAQHDVPSADRRLADTGLAHANVPALDVGDSEASYRDLADAIGGNELGAPALVTTRRFGPRRTVELDPLVEDLGDRAAAGGRRRLCLELRRDPEGIALRPDDGSTDLGGLPALVATGEDPDLPDPASLLPNRRHGANLATSCRDGVGMNGPDGTALD